MDLQLHINAEYFTFLCSWFMGMPSLLGFAFFYCGLIGWFNVLSPLWFLGEGENGIGQLPVPAAMPSLPLCIGMPFSS